MDPEHLGGTLPPAPVPELATRRRRLVAAGILIVIIALGVAGFFWLRSDNKAAEKKPGSAQVSDFKVSADLLPHRYMGNAVYDACNLLTLDTIRTTVPDYETVLKYIGTKKKAGEPMFITHKYIDRDISSIIGNDDQPRKTSTTVSEEGIEATDPGNFVSQIQDSRCEYSSGTGGRQTFAVVSVLQKPTPLSSDLLAFAAALESQGQSRQLHGTTAYVTKDKDSSGYYGAVFINADKSVAVVLKSGILDVIDKGGEEIAKKLAKEPTGAATISYPSPYETMPDPCTLLSAEDFERFTGKQAGTLAEEELTVTETPLEISVNEGQEVKTVPSVRRQCERFEVNRLADNTMTKVTIVLRQARDEATAKEWTQGSLTKIRDGLSTKATREKVGNESFIQTDTDEQGRQAYTFGMRIGKTLIIPYVDVEANTDASAEAFETRMLPVAKAIAQKYKR